MKAKYFRHDVGMRNDLRHLQLLIDLGHEGKGIYWDILEYLTEVGGHFNIRDCELIAASLHVDNAEIVMKILTDYKLFDIDEDGEVTSELVCNELTRQAKRSEQGRIASLQRKCIRNKQANRHTVTIATNKVEELKQRFIKELDEIVAPKQATVNERYLAETEILVEDLLNGERKKSVSYKVDNQDVNEFMSNVLSQMKEKEKRKEKESSPHTPFKEKENKKEKEKRAVGAKKNRIRNSLSNEPTRTYTHKFALDPDNLPEWLRPDMVQVFTDWLDYKREKRKSYATERTAKVCYDRLMKIAHDDAQLAAEIVEQSIANNWDGLFAIRTSDRPQNNNKQNANNHGNHYQTAQQARAAEDAARRSEFEAHIAAKLARIAQNS